MTEAELEVSVMDSDPRIGSGSKAGIFKQSMGTKNRVGIGLSNRLARAGIFKKSMGARYRGGIGLSYQPARPHRLAELMPWHRFLGSIKV
jgi:hypothetical protein